MRIDGTDATSFSTVEYAKPNVSVNGVSYNLIKAHTDWNTQSETVSLSLDTDSIYNNIKAFVDKYNDKSKELLSKLGGENKKINQGIKVNSAYSSKPVHTASYFIDKFY